VTYEQRLRTIPWPNGVNNKAIKNMISVKQILIFDAGKVVDAKNFTRFFLKRENLALFNEGSQGRYLPVFKTILSDPFWNNPRDVHIQVAKKMLSSFRLPYQVLNPAYTTVVQENIWGRAIEDICTKNAPITTAADDATKAIVKIFKDWNN
jgi:multiple sugar transport system substrate-binding protein